MSASHLAAPDPDIVLADVRRALAEDLGPGDVNVDTLPADARASARVISRQAITLAGAPWFEACLRQLDPHVSIQWHYHDGDHLPADATVCAITGKARALLSGERSALNFLQTLSATATTTARYAAVVAGTNTTILDTRKTLPGLRVAQKYAVRAGGGGNHRMGLFDAILIKENHIATAGGIAQAVAAARKAHPKLPLVVEVENLDELQQAIDAAADRVMLDEFSDPQLRQALELIDHRIPVEVSGSVDLTRLKQLANIGVDYISIGALTKNIQAVDLSMRITETHPHL